MVAKSWLTDCDPMDCSTSGFPVLTISWSLLKLMSIEWMVPSNHLVFSCPLSSCLQSFQHQGLFQWVGSLQQVAKVSELQLQHQSFQRIKLISSRIEWFDLLTSVHDYCKKNIALTIWTFVGKMMSVPFNMLSKFVIVFLPRTRHLLISWLQSWSTVILEPKEVKSVTLSIS